jgi:hypothetical protein
MRGTLVAVALALAAAGCGDLFKTNANEGYTCSPTGTCPPGQQCVPGEHVCRTPCTQTSTGGMIMSGQCDNIHQPDNGNGMNTTSYNCDVDHFCRPACNGGAFTGSCGPCAGTDVCDQTVDICRPACGGGCPTSWGCVAEDSGNGGQTAALCLACRPLTPSTFTLPTFAPVVYYGASVPGQHTFSLAVGDLAGNGHPSVIAVDLSGKKIYVFGNNGDGTLTGPTAYAPGGSPYRATVVDITRDGKADVVVAATPQPVVLAGNGDGTLAVATLGPTIPTTDLVAGDFDNDGKPDVAFCGSGTRQLNLTTADGAGGLKVIATYNAPNNSVSYVRIGAADFNADHKLDLYADDPAFGYAAFLNPGGSTFAFAQGAMNNGGANSRIDSVAFDATGDGNPDLVSILGSAPIGMPSTSWSFQIAAGNSAGAFTANMQSPIPGASAIAAGDFDGDGHIDAAIADSVDTTGKNAVHILSNTGTGLAYSAMFPITGGGFSIAVADLDGDGKPDIIVGMSVGVGVLMNTTPSH